MVEALQALNPREADVAGLEDAHGDRPLVDAARRGDRAAFAELHRRYAPMVHGIAMARVPVGEADDVVQEVFLMALQKLATLRDSEAIGPWLAAIARNLSVRFHRRRRSAEPLDDELAAAAREPGGEAASQSLQAIRELPDAYSETLMLRLVEGLTGPQIAACTGLTPGSVRVNLHRGFKLLRARLGLEDQP